mgnify:FL=1
MRIIAFIVGLSLMACTNPSKGSKESADASSMSGQIVQTEEKGIYLDIPVTELKKQLDVRPSDSYIILDVRTPAEISKGKIAGALEMNFYENFSEATSNLDESKEIFVYCAAGGRSAKASELLSERGFPKVYNILGGFSAWSSSGYPIQK